MRATRFHFRCGQRIRQPSAERDEGPRQPVGQFGKEQRDAEKRQKRDGDVVAIFIGLHRPAAADRRQRRDEREGRPMPSSSGKPRRKTAGRRGENERQHRQDAGAGDGQRPADIG